MSIDEESRFRLRQHLEELLGPEDALTLMSSLPPSEWSEIATKADLRSAVEGLRSEMAQLRTELRGEVALTRSEIRGDLSEMMRAQTRWLTGLLVSTMTALTAVVAVAPHL